MAIFFLADPILYGIFALVILSKDKNMPCCQYLWKVFHSTVFTHSDLCLGNNLLVGIKCVLAMTRTILFLIFFVVNSSGLFPLDYYEPHWLLLQLSYCLLLAVLFLRLIF
jgi:hypothetical protein